MSTKTFCIILIIVLWIIIFACIPIMKKISPESVKIYSVYVFVVGIAESLFLAFTAFS